MKKNLPGKKELNLIGLGTYNLKGKECESIVKEAIKIGYRHIDTAKIYENEKSIGKAIAKSKIDRKDLFITSKIAINTKNQEIENQLKKSLSDLNTKYLDLFLIHWPLFETNLFDVLKILAYLKKQTLIRNYGVSNFNCALLKECNKLGHKIYCNQIEYHPFIKQKKLLKLMQSMNILPVAYRPLLKGRIGENKIINNIAKRYKKTPFQITLKWITKQNIPVIPMTKNLQHLNENFNIFDFDLSDDDVLKINKLNNKNIRDVKNISDYSWDE